MQIDFNALNKLNKTFFYSITPLLGFCVLDSKQTMSPGDAMGDSKSSRVAAS